jgi:hypothetical protein
LPPLPFVPPLVILLLIVVLVLDPVLLGCAVACMPTFHLDDILIIASSSLQSSTAAIEMDDCHWEGCVTCHGGGIDCWLSASPGLGGGEDVIVIDDRCNDVGMNMEGNHVDGRVKVLEGERDLDNVP